jgi:hypothetical protein
MWGVKHKKLDREERGGSCQMEVAMSRRRMPLPKGVERVK